MHEEEKERQRGKERLKEERRKEKERAIRLAEERERQNSRKITRDDRIQVLNPIKSSDSEIQTKIYSRPSTPIRPKDISSNASNKSRSSEDNFTSAQKYSKNTDSQKGNDIFDNYTDNDDSNFFAPKISYKGNDKNKDKD
ncbi:MAG: hypothetical protein V1773_10555 [bacterium]